MSALWWLSKTAGEKSPHRKLLPKMVTSVLLRSTGWWKQQCLDIYVPPVQGMALAEPEGPTNSIFSQFLI